MFGGLISGLWNMAATDSTNSSNRTMNKENIAFQREQNELNREQVEKWNNLNRVDWYKNFNYQKALQEEIFNREDSAYARTVADMRLAGLSPLMMSGTNNAGQAMQTTPFEGVAPQGVAPQNSFSAINPSPFEIDPIGSIISFRSGLNQIHNQSLQNERLSLENKSLELDNQYKKSTIEDNIARNVAQKIIDQVNASDKESQKRFNDSFHLNQGMTEKERVAQIANTLVNPDSVKKVNNDYIPPTVKQILTTDIEPEKNDPSYAQLFRAIPILKQIFNASVKKSREDKLKHQEEFKKTQHGGR